MGLWGIQKEGGPMSPGLTQCPAIPRTDRQDGRRVFQGEIPKRSGSVCRGGGGGLLRSQVPALDLGASWGSGGSVPPRVKPFTRVTN